MSGIKFGTDGVRGIANIVPMDPETVFRIGLAAGQVLGNRGVALTGCDGRRSGPMLESALAAGLASAGVSVRFGGVIPTAAVSLAVKQQTADLGVMITASHNPATDNGVKLFAAGGSKISDVEQSSIEGLINDPQSMPKVSPQQIGDVKPDQSVGDLYCNLVRAMIPAKSLAGLKLVVDCANGAASAFAPQILDEAGANVAAIHHQPDGDNINYNCGSTYPKSLQEAVIAKKADIGIAFDGDADRVLLVDEQGQLIDGDQILARLATDWKYDQILRGNCVVATVMSNMGLERYLTELGLGLERTSVGDRHVAARMAELQTNLGGEQSGHILLPDALPSGDGLACSLLLLSSLAKAAKLASQHLRPFIANPQIVHNLRHAGGDPLVQPAVKTAIRGVVKALGKDGRVLVRASGTEPLIRIMAEAKTTEQAQTAIDTIAKAISAVG